MRFSFLRRFSLSAKLFQLSLLPWEVIYDSALFSLFLTISIHAPHMESDKEALFVLKSADDFNSRSLRGERLLAEIIVLVVTSFQFPFPALGAILQLVVLVWRECISIHALYMGRDFSPTIVTTGFQFTLPVWGATNKAACFKVLILNFNSRSLHGERSLCVSDTLVHTGISILASFMGSDLANFLYDSQHSHFNSRSPYGERWKGGDSYNCV